MCIQHNFLQPPLRALSPLATLGADSSRRRELGLWSALVFFDHGSEMQLATALVINVLQLSVHLAVLPMGGADAVLLNIMQAATLVLTA